MRRSWSLPAARSRASTSTGAPSRETTRRRAPRTRTTRATTGMRSSLEDNVNAAHNRRLRHPAHPPLGAGLGPARHARPAAGHAIRQPKKLKQFTRAALAQFPNVKYWGVWNEPNYRTFLSPRARARQARLAWGCTGRSSTRRPSRSTSRASSSSPVRPRPSPHWDPKGRPTAAGPDAFRPQASVHGRRTTSRRARRMCTPTSGPCTRTRRATSGTTRSTRTASPTATSRGGRR